MTDDVPALSDKLFDGLIPMNSMATLHGAGVYIFCIASGCKLPGVEPSRHGALYVGMTKQSLNVRNHFLHANSGRSTLRRSLGALLIKQLNLSVRPRSAGRSERDAANYRFDDAAEDRLSAWMATNLRSCQHEIQDNVRAAELSLIATIEPPLNLTDWANPQRAIVNAARARCRAIARDMLVRG